MRSNSRGTTQITFGSRTNQSSANGIFGQQNNTTASKNSVSDIKRMLARDSRSTQTQAANSLGQESIVTSTLSYSEALRNQRQQTKNTTLALKKLKYQFKNISSKILRSKTSQAAKQAAGQARREVLRLKRQKQSGNYDDEEIEAAINHAKAMERVAKKKAKHLEEEDMDGLMRAVLYEFPLRQIEVNVPQWIQALPEDDALAESVLEALRASAEGLSHVRDVEEMVQRFELADAKGLAVAGRNLGTGTVNLDLPMREGLFYEVLGKQCGQEIRSDAHLMSMMTELVKAKREYDRVAPALEAVRTTGYGLVAPSMEELTLQEPELTHLGGNYGVKLKASAPSLHMIRVDIATEVNPIIGSEKESEDMIHYLLSEFESDPAKLWNTNIFGKSLHDLVREGLAGKLMRMPEDAQNKTRQTLSRIINEGSGGMICILL